MRVRSWYRPVSAVLAIGVGALLAAATEVGRESQPSPADVEPVHSAPVDHTAVVARPDPLPVPAPSPAPGPDLWEAMGEAYRDGKVITGQTPHRLILFTFDDGPDRRYTPRLLDHLDAAGVRAVFFLTASRIEGVTARQRRHREIAREIVRRGHIVGNHTLDHLELPAYDTAEVNHQMIRAEEIFVDLFGRRPWLLRPPGGGRSPRVDGLIASRGYTSMVWNLGTGDHQVRTPEEVLGTWSRVFDRRERDEGDRGGIVLLHDTHEWSVDAFPLIVAELRRRNCDLLERGEELYDIVGDPAFFYAPRGDADPAVTAPPARPDEAVLEERQARLREETHQRCNALAAASHGGVGARVD